MLSDPLRQAMYVVQDSFQITQLRSQLGQVSNGLAFTVQACSEFGEKSLVFQGNIPLDLATFYVGIRATKFIDDLAELHDLHEKHRIQRNLLVPIIDVAPTQLQHVLRPRAGVSENAVRIVESGCVFQGQPTFGVALCDETVRMESTLFFAVSTEQLIFVLNKRCRHP